MRRVRNRASRNLTPSGEFGVASSMGVVAATATGLLRGALRFRPLTRAGCAALRIPRPCAFHALQRHDTHLQSRRSRILEEKLHSEERMNVRRIVGCVPCLLPCARSVPRFSQQGQTINVRAANARALAKGARVPHGQTLALPASPHVSRFFVVRIHSRLKDTQEKAHDANQRIEQHRTSIRYYGNEIAGSSAQGEGRSGGE
jgi:hypothetical protein